QKKENTSEKIIHCPKCQQGTILKGKTAYGCSEYKKGCHFKVQFEQFGKKLTENQILTLISKKQSPLIKGFTVNGKKVDGKLSLNEVFEIILNAN
ncbi:MAG: DNA topoisomerase III, partial [Bacteroidales bacterium]|nr:DNA topoisomerase III [Bacteroidales bacterium]